MIIYTPGLCKWQGISWTRKKPQHSFNVTLDPKPSVLGFPGTEDSSLRKSPLLTRRVNPPLLPLIVPTPLRPLDPNRRRRTKLIPNKLIKTTAENTPGLSPKLPYGLPVLTI